MYLLKYQTVLHYEMSCTALNVGESEPDVYVSEIKQSDVENDVSFCVGKLLVFA